MSDNKKYYYIKLKDNYFDQDNIKILESVKNGHIYSLIIVKLYLKATKYGGQLRMTESIPYDPSKIDILANVLNHDIAHVKEAIKLASELGIISILDTGAMWMDEIQNFIGNSSSEADRIREYRKGLKSDSVQLYDKSTPKKEIELEIKKDKELKIKEVKHKHGEYKKVLLTDTQYNSLLTDWGLEELNRMIKLLDESMEMNPKYKYSNFKIALTKWKNNSFNSPTKKDAFHAEANFTL